MVTKNHYEILRISHDADVVTIKQAYRKLAQLYHPDKRTNKKFAEHKFGLISEAYAVLSDPAKRSEYDQTIVAPRKKRKTTRKKSKAKRAKSEQTDEVLACRFWEIFGSDIAGTHCYRNGKRHGKWEMHFKDGQIETGHFVDGERNGKWTLRFANGGVWVGSYLNGKMHGQWRQRFADGDTCTGHYVDGERNGKWTIQRADGSAEDGPFVNGKLYGQWEERFANGAVFKGGYVEDKKHGFWKEKFADGSIQFCLYDMGEEKETCKVSSDSETEENTESGFWWVAPLGFIIGILVGRNLY